MKTGKRTAKRRAMNIRLKKLMVALGIDSCELRLPRCLKNWAMSFAHSKKSRYIITDEDWMTAVLACPNCHKNIEDGGHERMERIVLETIANRGIVEPDFTDA